MHLFFSSKVDLSQRRSVVIPGKRQAWKLQEYLNMFTVKPEFLHSGNKNIPIFLWPSLETSNVY